jgi:hypothetical protein
MSEDDYKPGTVGQEDVEGEDIVFVPPSRKRKDEYNPDTVGDEYIEGEDISFVPPSRKQETYPAPPPPSALPMPFKDTSERGLLANEYDTDEDEDEYEDEDDEMNYATGYIYINCHAGIYEEDPDTGEVIHPVPVPDGKDIIKKNQSVCGEISIVDSYSVLKDNSIMDNITIRKLIDNIDTCLDINESKKRHNIYKDAYKDSLSDADDNMCNIMRNKTHYKFKIYEQGNENDKDYHKYYSSRGRIPRQVDVIYFINIYNNGTTGRMYNLFEKSDVRDLFKDHKWHWTQSTLMKNKAKDILKSQSIISRDATRQLEVGGVYDEVTTRTIFDIISVLPYKTIKILDLSCNKVYRYGIELKKAEVDYDYSDNNKIGYGGYKKTRKNKSTRRSSKSPTKKVTSKRHIRGKLRRTKHIKRSRRKKITRRA